MRIKSKNQKDLENKINKNVDAFEKNINYSFKNKDYILEALTHSSFSNENRNYKFNERMEFLGDSILGMVVSDYIFNREQNVAEGELTKIRANVVCEESLSIVAKNIELGRYILLGKGEKISGGRNRDSILADAMEAIIAAIYLDGGIEEARNFVMKMLGDRIDETIEGNIFRDYKTSLQEVVQRQNNAINYKLIDAKGPDHNKKFIVEALLNGKAVGVGEGKSKKEAEKEAAKNALVTLGKGAQ